jgi:hypothetical protein
VKRVLKVPSDEHPTSKHTSVHAEVAATQERHRTFDPARHQVAVRRLTVRQFELPAEVSGRHPNAPRQRFHIEGLRVLAVYAVTHAPQPGQVFEALLRGSTMSSHPDSIWEAPNPPGRRCRRDAVITADRAWGNLGLDVPIELIR